jgi:hypothetical protein
MIICTWIELTFKALNQLTFWSFTLCCHIFKGPHIYGNPIIYPKETCIRGYLINILTYFFTLSAWCAIPCTLYGHMCIKISFATTHSMDKGVMKMTYENWTAHIPLTTRCSIVRKDYCEDNWLFVLWTTLQWYM